MPLYRIEIFKTYGLNPKPWANSYWSFSEDLTQAGANAVELVEIERQVHSENVTFRYSRTSRVGSAGTEYQTTPINLAGLTTAAQELPLFNSVRVDFGVLGSRPMRKYLRTPIPEGSQQNGTLETAYHDYIVDNYAVPVRLLSTLANDNGPITDESGNLLDSETVSTQVRMRSLVRRRKRIPTAPGA